MNTCTKASASLKQEVEENYTKNLAASMRTASDKLSEQLLTKLFARDKRDSGQNEYLHGALNAIHEIT